MIEFEEMAEGWEAEEDEELDDLFTEIYVENSTNIIYEVHMFDGFCLVRPASPNVYAAIRKLTHVEFSGEFREYHGDHEAVRNYLRNAGADLIIE